MRVHSFAAVAVAAALLAAGCTAAAPLPPTQTSAPVTAQASAYATWEDVLAAAEATTVNWSMWGGSDVINTNVDNDIGVPLKEQFDVTLQRAPVDNTADAVNKILARS